jgi:hypothetical protein
MWYGILSTTRTQLLNGRDSEQLLKVYPSRPTLKGWVEPLIEDSVRLSRVIRSVPKFYTLIGVCPYHGIPKPISEWLSGSPY